MANLTRRQLVAAAAAAPARAAGFPLVPFGPHRISRLIVGGNPISGNSHVSDELSREMMDYFSAANVKRLLADCERAGINTWQSRGDRHIQRLLREYRNDGGRMQWIAQTASELADIPRHIQDVAAQKPIAIYLHGTMTDRLWAAGRIAEARETLQQIRDTGVRVGLATHIPEVIDWVEERGWDVDFYMTSLYNLSRSKEDAARLAGRGLLPPGSHFYDPDREAMLRRVARTPRQCLIFKVYGASRLCSTAADMRNALRLVAASAKPHDAVIAGMFPKHKDQVAENRRLFLEAFGAPVRT
jgi:hypothetical protein